MPSNLSTTLLDDIARLYIDADDYNVIITAGQGDDAKVFRAHTVILRSRSSYFRVALSSNWAKKIPSQYNHGFHTQCDALYFNKPNISPKVFEIVLKYIYTGTCSLEANDILLDILIASDEFGLFELVNYVQEYIISDETGWLHKNFVKVFKVALRHDEFHLLREHCGELIRFNGLHAALVSNWINHEDNEIPTTSSNIPYKFKLLLRGSRDGRNVVTFHELCDFKGATIVLIKVMETGELIGGYNPNSWTSSDRYIRTTESFIFSLGNNMQDPSNYVLSRVRFAEFAIRDSSSVNTSIGFGNDFWWFEGKCMHFNYNKKILDTRQFFSMEDYEVFQVVKNE
ncbi:21720_t:CDS:2 [Cetraspora pellucida]|uniref:21720_t:CDS:1 n=1 Tax=Cetraspora pellucida TaxID=1433469 RepID=A0A9N9E471_9GLOM|nr:21720_t:CDS:2 [Cetraspora pellucida]